MNTLQSKKNPRLRTVLLLSAAGVLVTILTAWIVIARSQHRQPALANFEVLSIPASGELYPIGARWMKGLGASGKGLSVSKQAKSADLIQVDQSRRLESTVDAQLKHWIASKLQIATDDVLNVRLEGVAVQSTTDAYDLAEEGDFIWETITANQFRFSLGQKTRDEASSKNKMGDGISLESTVGAQSEAEYVVKSSLPLVVAIKIVHVSYAERRTAYPLNVTNPMISKSQDCGDYSVTLLREADPIESTIAVRVDPIGFARSKPNDITLGKEVWINSSQTMIHGSDSNAPKHDFIWDRLSLDWSDDLAKCKLNVVRQYITVTPTESGLEGTR